MEKLLNIEEIAEFLGLEYKTVYWLVRNGAIPSARIGRVYRVSKADLETYLEQQKQAMQTEAKGKKHIARSELRCSQCGKRIVSELGIAGRCKVCDAALCTDCFGLKKKKYCEAHEEKTN
jgi:excisionase family DNA binding protein